MAGQESNKGEYSFTIRQEHFEKALNIFSKSESIRFCDYEVEKNNLQATIKIICEMQDFQGILLELQDYIVF